jgi:hypothetical protein
MTHILVRSPEAVLTIFVFGEPKIFGDWVDASGLKFITSI